MASNEELPSVRVEVEDVGRSGEATPVMPISGSSSSVVSGVAVLGVLLTLVAALLFLSEDADEAVAPPSPEDVGNALAQVGLGGDGPDVHLNIAESLESEVVETAPATLLSVHLDVVHPFGGGLVGFAARSDGSSDLPLLWFSEDGTDWARIMPTLEFSENGLDETSWSVLESNGPLLLLGGQRAGEMVWFSSNDALRWDRLNLEPLSEVSLVGPTASTVDSVLFTATGTIDSSAPLCTNTGPEFFIVEYALDGQLLSASESTISFGQDFVISQRLNGSFPIAGHNGRIGALDAAASFGEAQPCDGAVDDDVLQSSFRIAEPTADEVRSWPVHDKIGFDQTAVFRGALQQDDQEWFVFTDAGSVSLLNGATSEWSVVNSSFFADGDLNEQSTLSTSGRRLFVISSGELITVDLVVNDVEIDGITSSARLATTESLLGSSQSVRVLWASDESLIISSPRGSWLIDASRLGESVCLPEYAPDRGGVGTARRTC